MGKGTLGLVAVGVTLLLFGVVGGVGWLLLGGGRTPPSSSGKKDEGGKTPTEQVHDARKAETARARRAVAGHSFWRVKVSEADVDAIVDGIVAEKGASVVWIDDKKNVVAEQGRGADPAFRGLVKDKVPVEPPEGVGARRIMFDLYQQYSSRPDARTVLLDLEAKLDAYDYVR